MSVSPKVNRDFSNKIVQCNGDVIGHFGLIFKFLSPRQMTPLHLAAESGHMEIVKHLVEQGAVINIQDDNGVILQSASRLAD